MFFQKTIIGNLPTASMNSMYKQVCSMKYSEKASGLSGALDSHDYAHAPLTLKRLLIQCGCELPLKLNMQCHMEASNRISAHL